MLHRTRIVYRNTAFLERGAASAGPGLPATSRLRFGGAQSRGLRSSAPLLVSASGRSSASASTSTSTAASGSTSGSASAPAPASDPRPSLPSQSDTDPSGPFSDPPAKPKRLDLLETYRALVAEGKLTWDDEQVRVVMKLRRMYDELENYEPPLHLLAKLGPTPPKARSQAQRTASRARTWWTAKEDPRDMALVKVLSGEEEIEALDTPKGILLTGPPGSGKSLLLSLLYDALPDRKARHHHHAFTLWIYQRVFGEMERRMQGRAPDQSNINMEKAGRQGWRAVFASGRWKGDGEEGEEDPRETIPFVIAKEMILEYHVLYFDELQLLDASSAALIRDVLSWYWRLGGVILSCSNRVPDDLYHHGVQRERMAGFLDALKSRCEVVQLDNGRDFRRIHTPTEEAPRRWLDLEDAEFEHLWDAESSEPAAPRDLVVYGRRLTVPATKGTAARFDFETLCETALGPADYITLASSFETFYIDAVPVLLLKHKNEARRLINLIDALYESRCKIVVRAAASPEHLFFPDALDPSIDPEHHDLLEAEALSESLGAQPRANVSVYNPATRAERERLDRADIGSSFAVMSIFTGEDERFAYKRAVSRLVEMSKSAAYAASPWLPLAPGSRAWEAADGDVTPAAIKAIRHTDPIAIPGKPDSLAREMGQERGDLGDDVEVREGVEREGGAGREGAPRIKEVHHWGVEDRWGPKAGRWGMGARVYDEEGAEGQAEGRLRWRRGGEQ